MFLSRLKGGSVFRSFYAINFYTYLSFYSIVRAWFIMDKSIYREMGVIFAIFGIWIIFYVLSNELVIYWFSISWNYTNFIFPLVIVDFSVVLVVCGLVLVVCGGGVRVSCLSVYLFCFLLICYLIFMFMVIPTISCGCWEIWGAMRGIV